jgi:hypothetical protein
MTHRPNSKPHFCPCCGQRVLLRLGVLLSPRQADVFDVIQRQNKCGGIRMDTLADLFKGNRGCLKVHISNINKKLALRGWRIVCEREGSTKGFYRIKRGTVATVD